MKVWQTMGFGLFLITSFLVVSGCGSDSNNTTTTATTSTSFKGVLTGGQEVPAVTTTASGTGSFVLNADKTELTFNFTVDGLSGAIAAAHFHNAALGSNGGVVRALTANFTGNTATGTWKSTDGEPLNAFLVTELEAGRIYVNVHTVLNPGGEIRAQLMLIPTGSSGFTAKADGTQEVPALPMAATGTAAFSLNAAKTELSFDITVTGLSGAITASHFHNAAAGSNGGVVRALTAHFTGNTATGIWKNIDGEPLTSFLVTELEAGRIYLNVHTAANPGGEIRGQVVINP